jgi:hypothetical protein
MATKPQTTTARIPALRVRSCSPLGTFRRGGEAFTQDARTIPLADLTEAQIKAIRGETRMLVVEDVEIDPPAEAEAST